MNVYPTLPWAYDGEERNVLAGNVRLATNGKPRGRILGDRRRKVIPLLHHRLTRAEMDALMAFYDANQVAPFTYNRTRDGVAESYTVIFDPENPPQERYVKGGRFDVRVRLLEV